MISSNYSYLIIIICLHTVIWFQIFLFKINNLLTVIKSIDETLTGITTLSQGGSGSNGNEKVPHTPQPSKPEAFALDAV